MEITVVTPSFNEQGNIKGTVERISAALKGIEHEIIVEDDSTDKTPDIVKSLEKEYPVRLFHRKGEARLGLAEAIVHGIGEAKGKYICTIDSDLQHPPEKVADMYQKATETNADMVFASRYVPGGSAEGLHGPIRKLASLVTKYLAYIFVDPARKTSDPASGFFLFKKAAVKDAQLAPIGYKISIEILARGNINTVEDVPYVFKTRTADDSKFDKKQVYLYIKHLLTLFFTIPALGRFIKFGLVGVSGTVLNLGIVATCKELVGLTNNISSIVGIGITIFTNFLLNNAFTWKDLKAKSRQEWLKKVGLYYIGSGVGAAVTFGIFWTGTEKLGIHYLISQAIGIIVAMVLNFLFSNIVVWNKNKKAPKQK